MWGDHRECRDDLQWAAADIPTSQIDHQFADMFGYVFLFGFRIWLEIMVELDEGFFSTEILDDEKDKPLKRGKESQKKSKVLVMAQTEEGTPSKKSDKPTSVK